MEAAPHNKKPPVGSGGFLFDSRQPAEIILSAINLRPDGYDGRTGQQLLGALLVGQHVRGFAVGVEGFRAFPDLIEKERAVFGTVLMEIVPDTAFSARTFGMFFTTSASSCASMPFFAVNLAVTKHVSIRCSFLGCPLPEKHLFRNPENSGERPLLKNLTASK